MKIEKDNSLTISGFEGIGNSVLSDFSDALGINTKIPGVIGAGYKFSKLIETKTTVNFSIASSGQDYFTLAVADTTLHKMPVVLTTTGTLPAPLATSTVYYLWDINGNGLNFRFSESLRDVGSSYLNLTDQGTGTHSFTRITPEEIKGYTFDSYSNLYLLDDEQKVWFSQSSESYAKFYLLAGNTSAGQGNGIVYYGGYILIFGNAKIDALAQIQDTSGTLTWDNDFASASSISSIGIYPRKGACPFYSQYDNAIYFANDSSSASTATIRVGLLEENVGEVFDPSDTDTFSIVADAIELPNDNGKGYVQSINEVGENLILGTQGKSIYFWDRKSLIPYSVVNMPENNTPAIIVKGSGIFAFNGYNGKFYSISSQDYGEVFDIPEHLFNNSYTANLGTDNTIKIDYVDATQFLDEILFSIEVSGNCYVMSYNPSKKSLVKLNISANGETLTTGTQPGRIYKIIPLDKSSNYNNNILISSKKEATPDTWAIESWQYGTTNKFHQVYDNDTAYITTGLLSYGESYSKKTIRELQVSLLRALTTGQGIKIYYRKDDNSAFTLLKEISYTLNGAIKDIKIEAPITDIIDLQIKIVINGYNGATTGTSPLIKLIRLIP